MGVRLNTLKLFDLVISKVILTSIEEITQNMAKKKVKTQEIIPYHQRLVLNLLLKR